MSNNAGDAGAGDDFLEQILGFPVYAGADTNLAGNEVPMMLQLNSGDRGGGNIPGGDVGGGGFEFPLGLSLEQGKGSGEYFKMDHEEVEASGSGKRFRVDEVVVDSRGSHANRTGYQGQPIHNAVPAMSHPPAVRPRVRARRGQATDPHSIAERLRRERIAERIRALQELVPGVNKTDRAAMLDEIVDYVKFLRLQVKVLSMSRLGGAGAVAPLFADTPISSLEEEGTEGGGNQPAWEKWSNDGTEQQVAKLMDENVGAAMQFLQSKALCIMPISLATAIYHTQPPDSTTSHVKPETNPQL